MGDLSVALNNSGIGGYLGDAFLNHLCYADDMSYCLFSILLLVVAILCNLRLFANIFVSTVLSDLLT